MARLRVRLRFNPGRKGAPLDRLGEFAIQVEKFLRSLSDDIGAQAKKGEWLASNFTNESVGFDNEYANPVFPDVADKGLIALRTIAGGNPLEAANKGLVSYGTLTEFSRLGKAMDPDEHFDMGLYETDVAHEPTEWKQVTYGQTAEIRQLLDAPFISYGSVQGIMHGWTMEGDSPNFVIRELSSSDLVKCLYEKKLHSLVHEATESPHSVLIVYGDMKWDRATNSIVEVSATDLLIVRTLTEAEFENLFGAAPGYTGSLTSSEYIEWLRGDVD